MKLKTLLSLLVCYFVLSVSHAQGKLNRAKDDLSGSSSSTSSNSRSWNDDDDDWGDDDGFNFFEGVFFEIAYHATIGILIGDGEKRYFHKYPYSHGSHGEYAYPEDNVPMKTGQLILSNTFFTSGKQFYGNDVKLNYRFVPLAGIEVNHLHFFEENPKSELGVSSFMFNYYRVREQYVTAFWGVGATHVGNGVDETGFTYQVGVDVYLHQPISITALWKQSFINDSTIDELKLNARYHLKRFSVHGGYNRYKLGSVRINALSFGVDYRF
ncbi:hypothetical protein [Kordia sp.]|uniref:hypothetical protein n=1 Tax=Kordia sp. TaxID=1965332 RepID=UPI0025C369CA|nr:hypothetical protein [Kordia sp.]MCH2194020.1 hypothetical protein [Kordia sp.]